MCAACIPDASAGPASRLRTILQPSCAIFPLSVFSLQKPSNPFDSHTFNTCSRKLLPITYFQKIAHQYQNNGIQPPQNHILIARCFATPLESHTFKNRGRGFSYRTSDLKPPTSPFANSFPCHSYGLFPCKSFVCHSYTFSRGEGAFPTTSPTALPRHRHIGPSGTATPGCAPLKVSLRVPDPSAIIICSTQGNP
jgi:hypothetical protein